MLKSLSIRNYALIRDLQFEPEQGLNTLTGETGAGKSILLGALGLLLGERADTRVLLEEGQSCQVSATFDVAAYKLKPLFEELKVPYTGLCELRREISPAGKSRASVNGSPAKLDQLKKLGEHLVDIHSQHETMRLGQGNFQLDLIDTLAGNAEQLKDYQTAYRAYQSAKKRLQGLKEAAGKAKQDEDYLRFQHQELEAANLAELNQEDLEAELKRLENAEDILQALGQAQAALSQEEFNALALLAEVAQQLRSLSGFSGDMSQLAERMNSLNLELDDLSSELDRQVELTDLDPQRLSEVKSTLDDLYRLQAKHKLPNVAALIHLQEEIANQLAIVDDSEGALQASEQELEKAEDGLKQTGEKLRESRHGAASRLPMAIEPLLADLGMPSATVEVEWQTSSPSLAGLETVELLFSANRGLPPKELRYVASGGEFSRLMFAFKHLLAEHKEMPTLIFDEVDTGISGEVAQKMARLMATMALRHQMICITHLPQIAAKGQAQFFVYKDEESELPASRLKRLSNNERKEEIASMISGSSLSESALLAAQELLEKN